MSQAKEIEPQAVRTQTVLLEAPQFAPERIGKYYVVHEVGRGSTFSILRPVGAAV